MRSGELLGRMLFFKTSIQFRLIPAVMADSVNAASRVCRTKEKTGQMWLNWDEVETRKGNWWVRYRERSRKDTGRDGSIDNGIRRHWQWVLLTLISNEYKKNNNVLQTQSMRDNDPWLRHSPGSETHSSSPHQTQTPSCRILGQSLHPSHLSIQETQHQDSLSSTFLLS